MNLIKGSLAFVRLRLTSKVKKKKKKKKSAHNFLGYPTHQLTNKLTYGTKTKPIW